MNGVSLRRTAIAVLCALQMLGLDADAQTKVTKREPASTVEKKAIDKVALYHAISRVERDLGTGFADFNGPSPKYSHQFRRDMDLVELAASQGVTTPALSERWQHVLETWRKISIEQRVIEQAGWLQGPARISLSGDLEEIDIPKGVKLLDPVALDKARQQLGRAKTPTQVWSLVSEREWLVTIVILSTGLIDNTRVTGSLLSRLAFRSNPLGTPGSPVVGQPGYREFNSERLDWLIEPRFEDATAKAKWAYTTGYRATHEIGRPDEVVMRWVLLGNQQILLAEFKGVGPEEIERVSSEFEPMWKSLAFRPGHRHSDRTGQELRRSHVSLADVITGGPTMLEQSLNRNEAKRSQRLSIKLAVVVLMVIILLPIGCGLIYLGLKQHRRPHDVVR